MAILFLDCKTLQFVDLLQTTNSYEPFQLNLLDWKLIMFKYVMLLVKIKLIGHLA